MTLKGFITNHLRQANHIVIINEHDTIIYNGAAGNVPDYFTSIAEVVEARFRRRYDNMGNDIIISVTTK